MKKYFSGTKNILLLLVAIINLLGLIIYLPQLLFSENDILFYIYSCFSTIFINPLIYLGTLALITIFTDDTKHCIILNIFQLVSTFLLIALTTNSGGLGFESLFIVILFLVFFFLFVHAISVVIKFLILKSKKNIQQ